MKQYESNVSSHGKTAKLLSLKQRGTRPIIAASILAVMFLLAACGSSSPSTAGSPSSSGTAAVAASDSASASTGLKEFTVDELAKYDGQNGNPAYIAVDGNVYDVSGVGVWKDGNHFGKYFAGRDLSKDILLASHGKSKLSEVPLIGTLK